jgi:hydroxyacylglutathione hydrolase
MNDDLIIEQFRLGPLWNFSYLLGSRAAGEAAVVDPGAEAGALVERAAALGLCVTAVIATHFHTDHTAGIETILRETAAAVWVNHADEHGLRGHYRGPLRLADDRERLQLGDRDLELWHAPGHTPGSQWVVVDGAVFTGDSLMVGCVGRTGHEPDALERMWWTFQAQFPRIPDAARIYPGHDYGPARWSTAGEERRRNPGLRAEGFDQFVRALDGGG